MQNSSLSGKQILVTAGSTRAYIDAVRYISNYSSGRLGSEIAAECLRRGANVLFFHGEGTLTPAVLAEQGTVELSPDQLTRFTPIKIESVPHLAQTLESRLKTHSISAVVHAMAVLDYIPDPALVSEGKEKSDKQRWTIELIPTPKIIDIVKKTAPETRLVGFKLEVGLDRQGLLASAQKLIERSGADLVVANDMADVKDESTYKAILLQRDETGNWKTTDVAGRPAAAQAVCDVLEMQLSKV